MKNRGCSTLHDIKDRCIVDDITGCWNWAMSKSDRATPVVHIAPGVFGNVGRKTVPAYRAAWLMSGREIPVGFVVYRACFNTDCCNPKHLKCGTYREMHKAYSDSGKNKGQPHRIIVNAVLRARMMASRERVATVERMLADGVAIYKICQELRMDGKTVHRIRSGNHPNSSKAASAAILRHSSVFNMGGRA